MSNSGYPHPTFSIFDNSKDTAVAVSIDQGLFEPLFFTFAAKGTPNKILYTGDQAVTTMLGSQTFDETSDFYNVSTMYLNYAAGAQGAYVVRLVDPDATLAGIVIQAAVTSTQVPQYKTDVLGNRVLDTKGNPIPLTEADGTTPLTEPGISIAWSNRTLLSTEDPTALATVTTQNSDGSTTTTYPIVAMVGSSVGSLMNHWGIKLYRPSNPDRTTESNIASVLYRMVPYYLPPGTNTTATIVTDVNGQSYNDFSFKSVAIDSTTSENWAFQAILKNNYTDSNSNNLLDISFTTYGTNIQTIGTAALAVSPELVTLNTNAWEIDLITALDANHNPYKHIVVTSTSGTTVSADAIVYMTGGTDGKTDWNTFNSLIQSYCTNAATTEFANNGRFGFTHIIDPGVQMPVKTSLMSLLAVRPGLGLKIATQVFGQRANTEAEDIAAAQSLMAEAALYPESTVNGVPVMRVSLYGHCGELAGATSYTAAVSSTYARLMTLCTYDSGSSITSDPGGFPGSIVSVFDVSTLNWVPNTETEMSNAWGNGLNYLQYADSKTLFFPSLRTTYLYDTSLLSDDVFVDRVLYMMKLLWKVWAKYSGVRRPAKKLFSQIEKEATDKINTVIGQGITATVTLTQTAQDAALGWATDAIISIKGDMPMRVLNFQFQIGRSDS